MIRLLDVGKRHSAKYLNTKDQGSLKQDALKPPKKKRSRKMSVMKKCRKDLMLMWFMVPVQKRG